VEEAQVLGHEGDDTMKNKATVPLSDSPPAESYQREMDRAHEYEGGELVGTELEGRYRIERRIGSGGMGTVYLAQQLSLRMPVAVKVLSHECSQDFTYNYRFIREARVAARVVHPNVARVLDLGRTPDGRAFSVMEHLQGEDLSELLAREGALPWSRARRIIRQVVRGLRAAHAIGVIHRDVKPSNVFLAATANGREQVKLLDFGIAKACDPEATFGENLTRIDKIVGTMEYIAPERILGEAADARSDIYSLGVMVFEMLTGHQPWPTEGGPLRALMKRVREAPPSLPEFLPGVPHEVVAAVKKAMARDPADRFASLQELEAALLGASPDARAPAATAEPRPEPRPEPSLEPRPAAQPKSTPVRWPETLTWGVARI
jgi:serine/threonine protein kinase